MKYLYINFDDEKYWLEIGTDAYALRQIIIDADNQTHVSCFEDCLAEGVVIEDELDGKISMITKVEFENQWNIATSEKRKTWVILKKQYPIDTVVVCKVKYFYPQGCILEIGDLQGICTVKSNVSPNDSINGKVIGYDETNMWLIISEME
jgi:ribosomal protein S1